MATTQLKHFFTGVLVALLLAMIAWPVLAGPAIGSSTGPINGINSTIRIPFKGEGLTGFDGVSPQVIPAAAFVADGFDPASSFFSFSGGYYTGNSSAYGCLTAPVYLPANQPVATMFASVYDNDPLRSLTVSLRRVDNFTGSGATMASVGTSSSGASAGIQILSDQTVNFPVIRAPDYSYFVTVCLPSNQTRLYSVRLYTGYELFLPYVKRN